MLSWLIAKTEFTMLFIDDGDIFRPSTGDAEQQFQIVSWVPTERIETERTFANFVQLAYRGRQKRKKNPAVT